MNYIARRILAVMGVVIIIMASFFTWFYIKLLFNGCCGAHLNSNNDGAQSLAHFGAYVLAVALAGPVLWWGLKKSKGQPLKWG